MFTIFFNSRLLIAVGVGHECWYSGAGPGLVCNPFRVEQAIAEPHVVRFY